MKTLQSLFLLFASCVLVAQADCTISDSLYNELDAQAAQILINEMVADRTASDSPIELDSTRRAQYLSALFAVHQLENSPERDTVIDQLGIRPFLIVSTRVVRLFADSTLSWMRNLRTGNPSGNPVLDSMMTRYGLENVHYEEWSFNDYDEVELMGNRHLNTLALVEAFEAAMPDLDFADPLGAFGDGDNIEMIPLLPDGWRVRYSVGSGDCPAGCIFRRNYDFDVEPACTEFEIQQTGGTATRQAAIIPLKVYPVPFTDEINLPETITRYSYQIFDVVGRSLENSGSEQDGPIVGLQGLVPGWYVLKICDQKGKIYMSRIIKR